MKKLRDPPPRLGIRKYKKKTKKIRKWLKNHRFRIFSSFFSYFRGPSRDGGFRTFSYFFRISRLEGVLSSIPGTRNRKGSLTLRLCSTFCINPHNSTDLPSTTAANQSEIARMTTEWKAQADQCEQTSVNWHWHLAQFATSDLIACYDKNYFSKGMDSTVYDDPFSLNQRFHNTSCDAILEGHQPSFGKQTWPRAKQESFTSSVEGAIIRNGRATIVPKKSWQANPHMQWLKEEGLFMQYHDKFDCSATKHSKKEDWNTTGWDQ